MFIWQHPTGFSTDRVAQTTDVGGDDVTGNLHYEQQLLVDDEILGGDLLGTIVRKTGRATGSTQGSIARTCFAFDLDVPVGGGGLARATVFCTHEVAHMSSGEGDSGAPIYARNQCNDGGWRTCAVALGVLFAGITNLIDEGEGFGYCENHDAPRCTDLSRMV